MPVYAGIHWSTAVVLDVRLLILFTRLCKLLSSGFPDASDLQYWQWVYEEHNIIWSSLNVYVPAFYTVYTVTWLSYYNKTLCDIFHCQAVSRKSIYVTVGLTSLHVYVTLIVLLWTRYGELLRKLRHLNNDWRLNSFIINILRSILNTFQIETRSLRLSITSKSWSNRYKVNK